MFYVTRFNVHLQTCLQALGTNCREWEKNRGTNKATVLLLLAGIALDIMFFYRMGFHSGEMHMISTCSWAVFYIKIIGFFRIQKPHFCQCTLRKSKEDLGNNYVMQETLQIQIRSDTFLYYIFLLNIKLVVQGLQIVWWA